MFTNIEGLFLDGVASLGALMIDDPDDTKHSGIVKDINGLQSVLDGSSFPFTVTVRDPSGNSFIMQDPQVDSQSPGKYRRTEYERNESENIKLGLNNADAADNRPTDTVGLEDFIDDETDTSGSSIVKGETLRFPIQCSACGRDATMLTRIAKVPGFEECQISGVHCDHCGFRTSDVSVGGATPEKGRKITLQVKSPQDLVRDVLTSEFAVLEVPYVPLRAEPGSFSGRFTTVEGLLTRCKDNLRSQLFDAGQGLTQGGDSMTEDELSTWSSFFDRLHQCMDAEVEYELIITDPMARSYIQRLTDEDMDDPQLEVVDYERTEEENEELGLNDMKVENYEEEEAAEGGAKGADTPDSAIDPELLAKTAEGGEKGADTPDSVIDPELLAKTSLEDNE